MRIAEEEKTKQGSQSNYKEKSYTKRNFNKKKQRRFRIPAVFQTKKCLKRKEVMKYVPNIS